MVAVLRPSSSQWGTSTSAGPGIDFTAFFAKKFLFWKIYLQLFPDPSRHLADEVQLGYQVATPREITLGQGLALPNFLSKRFCIGVDKVSKVSFATFFGDTFIQALAGLREVSWFWNKMTFYSVNGGILKATAFVWREPERAKMAAKPPIFASL